MFGCKLSYTKSCTFGAKSAFFKILPLPLSSTSGAPGEDTEFQEKIHCLKTVVVMKKKTALKM
jgi:hypothetical protein